MNNWKVGMEKCPGRSPFFTKAGWVSPFSIYCPVWWQVANYLMQKQLFLIIPDNADGWHFYWCMQESAFLAPSNLQLEVTRHQTLVWRRECTGLAPATQANEANVKKRAGIYSNLDPAIDEGTGKVWIGFHHPQETNYLPNGQGSGVQLQHNTLERDTLRIIVTQAAKFRGNWKRITNYKDCEIRQLFHPWMQLSLISNG